MSGFSESLELRGVDISDDDFAALTGTVITNVALRVKDLEQNPLLRHDPVFDTVQPPPRDPVDLDTMSPAEVSDHIQGALLLHIAALSEELHTSEPVTRIASTIHASREDMNNYRCEIDHLLEAPSMVDQNMTNKQYVEQLTAIMKSSRRFGSISDCVKQYVAGYQKRFGVIPRLHLSHDLNDTISIDDKHFETIPSHFIEKAILRFYEKSGTTVPFESFFAVIWGLIEDHGFKYGDITRTMFEHAGETVRIRPGVKDVLEFSALHNIPNYLRTANYIHIARGAARVLNIPESRVIGTRRTNARAQDKDLGLLETLLTNTSSMVWHTDDSSRALSNNAAGNGYLAEKHGIRIWDVATMFVRHNSPLHIASGEQVFVFNDDFFPIYTALQAYVDAAKGK